MTYVKFTDFRNHSKEYFDKIENGDSFTIIRRGKPVAQIIPFESQNGGWRLNRHKISVKGRKSSLDYLLEERNDNSWRL